MTEKYKILVVGGGRPSLSTEAFLSKFLNIVYDISKDIHLVSESFPCEFNGRIRWIKPRNIINNPTKLKFKIINHIFVQIYITLAIFKLAIKNKYKVCIFYNVLILPMLFSKLMRIKIIKYHGGSYYKLRFVTERNFLIRVILVTIFEVLPSMVSNMIIIESKSCQEFQKLENYKHKIVIAPLYVDTNNFYPRRKIKSRQYIIGYVGNIDENKGVTELCRAFILLDKFIKAKNIKINIIGTGPLLDYISNIITSSSISEYVNFIGWVSHASLPHYLNELKLLILPSNSEGLPNIILESMACGTPVLATPVGAIPDVIKDNVTGFILQNNSAACIAENIIKIMNYPDLDIISDNALALIHKNFTYESSYKRYSEILDCF